MQERLTHTRSQQVVSGSGLESQLLNSQISALSDTSTECYVLAPELRGNR